MTLTFGDTHNMVSYLNKSDASDGFNQIIDFLNGSYIAYALIVNPTIYVSCIKQFWNTVVVKQSNDVTRLQALVDKKRVVVTKAIIRDALHLDDAEGVDCLPNEEIFTTLARMGYEKPMVGKGCSGVETPLFEGMLIAREPEEQVDAEEQADAEEQGHDDNAAEELVTTVADVEDQTIQSPTPLTLPPQQPQDIPSTSQ
nr:xylulose kinase-1 [Tanacetum cinerariifolium]